MIYGVEAYDPPPPSPPPPTGLAGTMDFVNGIYNWDFGATTLTAADVIDQTGWLSGADGLVIPASSGFACEMIYSAMQAFLATCQFSAVFTVDLLDTTGVSPPANIMTIDNAGEAFYIQIDYWGEWEINTWDTGGTFAFDDVHGISTGVHKLAITQTDARTSLSVDGNAVNTDTGGVELPVLGFPMVNFYLGGWINNTGRAIKIHKVELYTPIADVDLPSHSA